MFNGKEVEMRKPRRMNPVKWKAMYDKKEGTGFPPGMKRLSIFYKLDYYENLPIAHLFDTIHIGKNVAEFLWKHLNGINLEAQIKLRKDLQVVNVMPNMWLHENNSYNHAPWTFTSKEKENIIDTMKSIRFPSGFGATLKNLFTRDGSEFSGLKIHDWHNWIKYVLPAGIPSTFDCDVSLTIYKLSKYLRWFSSKEIHLDDLKYWKRNVSLLMCDIQMCFPPSFFNSQEHYLVHLVEEIEQCGPIHIRTMWLVERYMKVLKQFVRQKARLQGSMVEGYMVFQAMVHLSEYLPQFHFQAPQLWNYNQPQSFEGEKLEGQGTSKRIKDAKEWEALHLYVAYNSDFMLEWMEKYTEQKKLEDEKAWANIYNIHGQNTARGLPTSHKRKWPERCSWSWLKTNIEHEATKGRNRVTQQQLNFMKGSVNGEVIYYKGMWNFGHHFRIKKVDEKRQTYDCGVSTSFEVECRSHANDRQPITSTLHYYGVLEDIIELDFMSFKKVIFHVEWYKLIKVGEEKTIFMHNNGFHMINTCRFEATSEPYVFPNQCDYIFFIPNLEQPGWSFVLDYDPRGRRVTYVEDNEDAEVPLDDENNIDGDDENFIVNDAYDQDEDHDEFIEVFEGHEQPHGHQVHEDDEFIDFNLLVVEGDEDHENASINLFVDLGPINDEVFLPSNDKISSEDDIV